MFNKFLLKIFIIVVFFYSCKSEYELLLKSGNNFAKYEKAIQYFEEGNYDKSIELFENVRSFYIGDDKSSVINYTLAESYYIKKDLYMASYYYEYYHKNFSDTLSKNAMYMDAYCNYMLSPKYTLEQSSTKLAIEKFQNYINKYPDTQDYKKVNEYIVLLRKKLEKKSFDICMLYLKHEEYKSCDVSLNTFLEEYPDADNIEEVYYYKVLSSFLYAQNSIESKQKERFDIYHKNYDKLLKLFPNTKYKEEIEKLK